LDNGYVWIGTANLYPITNPIAVYFDEALTIQATQPLRTINGFISNAGTPAQVYVDAVNFSILVQDIKGSMVYNFPDGTGISPDACGVIYDPPFTAGVAYPVCEKLEQTVSVKDFGAIGDGTTDDTQAFIDAANECSTIYVPAGTYRLDTPFSLDQTAAYFGPATLKFDNAETWRAGGSAGYSASTEQYTLFFKYNSHTDVYCNFNGVAQSLTFLTDNTFQVPAPAAGINVIYGVVNGTLVLGDTPEQIFSYNTFANGGWDVAPALPDPLTSPVGFNNVALGARAMKAVTTGVNNTAVGSRAMTSVQTGNNNTAIGFQAGYRATGDNNTTVGSIAGEWMTTASDNTFLGALCGSKEISGSYNTAVGSEAFEENETGNYNVAIGHRALANPREDLGFSPDETVAVGAFAGDFCFGDKNTLVGYRAGNGVNTGSDGIENVGVGFNALRNHNGADYNTAVGVSALRDTTSGENNVSVGHEALAAATTASTNVAIGSKALAVVTTVGGQVAVGYSALTANTSGAQNVAVGPEAMIFNTTGSNNTSIGSQALRIDQSAANQTGYDNTTGVGYQARVSGSNQVQLGNSATTTFAYGAVQNRSDLRDKADVRDTILGLDFINALRPVDFKWDYRDDYIYIDEENNVTKLPKDGSKKRNRYHHGLISQEVNETIASLGVDFGGFQDHKVNGGCDVLSLGYEELIAPLIKAVQELTARVKELEAKQNG